MDNAILSFFFNEKDVDKRDVVDEICFRLPYSLEQRTNQPQGLIRGATHKIFWFHRFTNFAKLWMLRSLTPSARMGAQTTTIFISCPEKFCNKDKYMQYEKLTMEKKNSHFRNS